MAATLFQPASHAGLVDFRTDLDASTEQFAQLLDLTQQVKQSRQRYASALKGRAIALLFEKPSLRTRMTFELAIKQLGGDAVAQNGLIGDREPLKDIARNLDRWTDAIVARTFSQKTVDDLAEWSRVPVINALSDLYHPCQALADLYTLKEQFGRLKGLKLAYLGDGNNVAHSLLLSCARMGVNISIAAPNGYEPKNEILNNARTLAAQTGVEIQITNDPEDAVIAANAVYTDVWASMGQEAEAAERKELFAPYQVNATLMGAARRDAIFMHCLPAKRGQEVTDEVIESSQSVVFDQAENRLHTQKALLLSLLQ
ncbi:MAG TPA: ornithine carbamoyltransferase [Bryobacteraceae bacterium]|jgi:ornithine carbamoyltransferase